MLSFEKVNTSEQRNTLLKNVNEHWSNIYFMCIRVFCERVSFFIPSIKIRGKKPQTGRLLGTWYVFQMQSLK